VHGVEQIHLLPQVLVLESALFGECVLLDLRVGLGVQTVDAFELVADEVLHVVEFALKHPLFGDFIVHHKLVHVAHFLEQVVLYLQLVQWNIVQLLLGRLDVELVLLQLEEQQFEVERESVYCQHRTQSFLMLLKRNH